MAEFNPDAYLASKAFDPDKYLAAKTLPPAAQKGLIGKALDSIGETYDKYVSAPARAGVSKLQDGEPLDSVGAWWDQIGKDPKTAPSGRDLAVKAGADESKYKTPEWLKEYYNKVKQSDPKYYDELKSKHPYVGEETMGGGNADLYGAGLNIAVDPVAMLPTKVAGLLGKGAKAVGTGIVDATKGLEETKLGTNALESSPQMFEHTPKPNVEEIKAASERLGIKPTTGMLSSNKNLQTMENVLSKSPTVPGFMTQKQYSPIYEGIENSLKKVGDVSPMTPNEVGTATKRELMGKIAERLDPLKQSYEDISKSTSVAPINEKMAQKASQRLMSQEIAKGTGTEANQIVSKYSEMLSGARDAKTVQNIISDAKTARRTAMGPAKIALSKSIDAGEKLLRRGLLTSATEGAGAAGKLEAKGLIKQIKDTNKGFRNLSEELGAATDSTSVRATSPGDVLNQIDSLKAEKLGADLFDVGNVDSLRALQKFSPEAFDVARQQRVGKLVEAATVKGKLSPQKFITAVKKIPRDAQGLLFKEGIPETLKDVETILNSMPELVNTSGTTTAKAWMHAFDPRNIPQQGSDYLKYRVLQGKGLVPKPPVGKISKGLIRTGKLGQSQQ